jgi:hypothetical protein
MRVAVRAVSFTPLLSHSIRTREVNESAGITVGRAKTPVNNPRAGTSCLLDAAEATIVPENTTQLGSIEKWRKSTELTDFSANAEEWLP